MLNANPKFLFPLKPKIINIKLHEIIDKRK